MKRRAFLLGLLGAPAVVAASASALSTLAASIAPQEGITFFVGTEEFYCLSMPSHWNEGAIEFSPIWTAFSGPGDVIWIKDDA